MEHDFQNMSDLTLSSSPLSHASMSGVIPSAVRLALSALTADACRADSSLPWQSLWVFAWKSQAVNCAAM